MISWSRGLQYPAKTPNTLQASEGPVADVMTVVAKTAMTVWAETAGTTALVVTMAVTIADITGGLNTVVVVSLVI